jgi:hypothetical protein
MFSGPGLLTPTRFTLTVTNAAGPVPIALNVPGGPSAGIDVKASGTFTANLLFEAQRVEGMDGSPIGDWVPVLDLYDVQETPPGDPPGEGGPVLTSFSRAFYFTNAATGMTLDAHDANITGRLTALVGTVDEVKSDTAFLRIEAPNRLAQVENSLNQVQNGINNLLQSGGTQDLARSSEVRGAKEELQQTLLVLFGLMPCPAEAQEICGDATLINDLATQASVEQMKQQLTDMRAAIDSLGDALGSPSSGLELQIVERTEKESPKRRRWLVRTSVNGSPAIAELTGLVAISTVKLVPALVSDVTSMATVTQLLPGLMEVILDVAQPSLTDLAFNFSVSHSTGSATLDASSLVGDVDKK